MRWTGHRKKVRVQHSPAGQVACAVCEAALHFFSRRGDVVSERARGAAKFPVRADGMGRLLDPPTPTDAAELRRTTRFADPSVPWPAPPCGSMTPRTVLPESRCTSNIAVLVAGEFRDFLPPFRPREARWRGTSAASVWKRLYETVVQPNGPADLFVHSWASALAHKLLSDLPLQPCAAICEAYNREYVERVLARYNGFRLIRGFLRLNNSRETPHIVDFFYKRYAAWQLVHDFERRRARVRKGRRLQLQPRSRALRRAAAAVASSTRGRVVEHCLHVRAHARRVSCALRPGRLSEDRVRTAAHD